jgi:hypothetical protein
MAVIRTLGEGYYGVETRDSKIDPVVFRKISETFQSVSRIPSDHIRFIARKPESTRSETSALSGPPIR